MSLDLIIETVDEKAEHVQKSLLLTLNHIDQKNLR